MIDYAENKEGKRNGLVTTILVHLILLVLCAFLGFTYLDPPKGDVVIGFQALGEENAGQNDDLATSEKVSDEHQEVQETPVASASEFEEEVATQEESPVAINQNTSNQEKSDAPVKESENAEPTKETPKVPSELEKAMGSLLQGEDQSGGKGDGTKDGNQGSEEGVPSADGQGGSGTDGMFDFGGRSAINPGTLQHDCKVQGTIHIRVQVDRAGNVISAEMVPGGTSYNSCLIEKAKSAAKSTKYTTNASGPAIQEGVIKLKFTLN